jgi:hypothetical protein
LAARGKTNPVRDASQKRPAANGARLRNFDGKAGLLGKFVKLKLMRIRGIADKE